MKRSTLLMFAVLLTVLAAGARNAEACGPRTFPKIECQPGAGGRVAARLCTNRRNGLAWEWILVGGQEARELCGDAQALLQPASAAVNLSDAEIDEARRNGAAARATANHRGVSFEDLLRQRRARVVGTAPTGETIYEYQSVGRVVRLL